MKKILSILLLSLLAINASAQNFPSRPVKIVLCLGAGSGPDVVARKMAEVLSEKWKQPVLVENKPGGGGIIGLSYLVSEPSDGYTIGFLDGGAVVSYPILNEGKGIDLVSKLEPVRPIFNAYMAVFTSSENKNFAEFKRRINENPSYGSWNIGSAGHVLGAEFVSGFSNNGVHVPYKDYGVWQADVANRNLSFSIGSTGSTKAMVQSGRNRLIAIANDRRDMRYPDVPTIKELTGQSVNTIISWVSAYVSTSVPDAVKKQLDQDLRLAANDPRVQEIVAKLDFIPLHNMPMIDFSQLVIRDTNEYQRIIRKFNIKLQ